MGRFLPKILLIWSLWLPLLVTGQSLSGEIVSIIQPGCSGPFFGEITVAALDGSPPYSYTLDGSLTQSSGYFSAISLGDHTIQINDDTGDDYSINFTIEINNQLIISVINLSHVDCFGDGDGSISVVASSGVSPFQFSIDGGLNYQSNGDFSNLVAGIYEITAIDASNCYDTVSAEIIALSQINVLSLNKENIDCFGDSTGSVQLLGELGTSPYQFSMDGINYQSSGLYTDIYAGTHQFWIEDLNGCSDSIVLNFTQPSVIQMEDFIVTSPICYNQSSGEIAFTASGGVSPYVFTIDGSNATGSPSFQNLSSNSYTIQMIDANACEIDSVISIDSPDSLYFEIVNAVLPLCNGQSNGSIEINGVGGIPPYDYKLGSGSWGSNNVFTNLSAGSYNLRVRDDNNCVFNQTFILNEPSPLNLSLLDQTNVYCNISNTGSIEVVANGGQSPFTYSLDAGPGQSSGLFSNLSSGNYSVNVIDNNLCSTSIDVEILETISLSIDDVVIDPAICGVSLTGQFTIMGSGGLVPYEYAIDNGTAQSSPVFLNVGIGMHDITIFTSDGCSVSDSYYMPEVSTLSGTVLSLVNPICEGGLNGSITLEGSGGTLPYTYSNDGGASWQASGSFSGLTDSTYIFRIIDQNFCSFDTLITFEEQSDLSIDLLSISSSICPNSASGTIEVEGQNGFLPYSYSLNNGSFVPGGIFNGLDPDDHSVTVMDANGCLVDSVFTIDAFETPSLVTDSLISPTCNSFNDGVIMVSPGGSATPYLYSFNASPFSPTNYFTGLSAGSYSIEVEDANACNKVFNIDLNDLAVFEFFIDSIHHVNCKDEEDGYFYYSFIGGQAPYEVSINSGAWINAGTSLGPLYAGNYVLDFRDSNGCVNSTIEQILEPSTALSISILSVVNVECNSDTTGSVLGFASGGVSPYEYSLDGIDFQTSSTFENLEVGNYNLYVKDANDCIETESFSIIANFPISLNWASVISPSCEAVGNGSIDVGVISSASPPFSFSLNNGPIQTNSLFSNLTEGSYTINVEDQNGCAASIDTLLMSESDLEIIIDSTQNIVCVADSSGAIWLSASGGASGYSYFVNGMALSGNSIQGLNNGVYTSWVVDAFGCTDSTEVAVLQESLLQGSIYSQQNILCNNGDLGSFTINGTTGTSPYLYSLDGVNFSNQNTFTDLEEGDYIVTIQDASDCQTTVDVSIEILVELDLQSQLINDPTCFASSDGSISVSIPNGIAPYSYSINNQAMTNIPLFEDQSAGDYLIYGEDSQGCYDSLFVQLLDPPAMQVVIDSLSMATCFGLEDGYLDVSSVNNQGSVTYSISPGNQSNAFGVFTGLAVDEYTISLVDANSCEVDSIISIGSPDVIDISYQLMNPLDCYGDENAIIEIIGSGGTLPYSFVIDSASNGTNQFVNNLEGGAHTISIIDQNNCQASMDLIIDEPDSMYFQTNIQNDITCFGLNNGNALFLVNGGTGNITYTLDTLSSNSGVFTNLSPGPYSLIASDESSCLLEFDFIIEEPPLLQIDSIIVIPPSCNSADDASLEILVSGGSQPYNYFIPGLGSSAEGMFTNLDAGAYYISITDQNGCNKSQIQIISDPEVYELGLTALAPPLCHGDSTAVVVLQSSGGNGSAVYGLSWAETSPDNVFDDLTAGLNTFYGIDTLGCRDSLTVFIPSTEPLVFDASIHNATCYELDNGWVQFAASGGVGGYQYSIDNIQWNTSGNFSGLGSGFYDFILQDANECLKDTTLFIGQPDSLYIQVNFIHPVTCSDPFSGEIDVSIIGGTAPYETILNDDTLQGPYISFTDLAVGSYQLFAIDHYNCEAYFDTLVTEVDSIAISVSPVALDCYGSNDGIASVNFEGGSGGYMIQWDNVSEDQTATTQANLVAGVTYTVIVSDSLDADCSAMAQVIPTQPEEIIFELFPFSGSCDPNDVSVSVEIVSGGVGPFQYSINNGVPVNSGIFIDVATISTPFTVFDSDACSETEWIIPENPNAIHAYFEVSDDVVSMADGEVIFTDFSVNAEYYKWDFGDNVSVEGLAGDQAIADQTTGTMLQPIHTYTTFGQFNAVLDLTSDFGCTDSFEKTITVEEDHLVYIPNSFTPDNDGVNDVFRVEGYTIDEDKFSLTIYDRSGDMIFDSFDINVGWDGTDRKGGLARPSVYVYMVSYFSGGKYFEKNGTVTLLR
jgi:gliding motility-associated-like protein